MLPLTRRAFLELSGLSALSWPLRATATRLRRMNDAAHATSACASAA
jgi:hypothetical protein